jgi:hypothetical protein
MSIGRRLSDAFWLALRPRRWSIFGFRFVPLVLFAAGVGGMVYGGFRHRIPVVETHEEQISIPVPVEQTMPPPPPPNGMPGDAQGMTAGPPPEAFGPPVKFIQAIKTTTSTAWERELAVNRAVTVAGMARGQQGEVVRLGDDRAGPGFCPS